METAYSKQLVACQGCSKGEQRRALQHIVFYVLSSRHVAAYHQKSSFVLVKLHVVFSFCGPKRIILFTSWKGLAPSILNTNSMKKTNSWIKLPMPRRYCCIPTLLCSSRFDTRDSSFFFGGGIGWWQLLEGNEVLSWMHFSSHFCRAALTHLFVCSHLFPCSLLTFSNARTGKYSQVRARSSSTLRFYIQKLSSLFSCRRESKMMFVVSPHKPKIIQLY